LGENAGNGRADNLNNARENCAAVLTESSTAIPTNFRYFQV
jgi:hypothetical protein